MIAFVHSPETSQQTAWQAGFLKMLPILERYARNAFRGLRTGAREDAVCEAIANCLCAYHRLYERNEIHRAFASSLVRYAVAQYYAGRRVGAAWRSCDVFSTQARKEVGFGIRSFGAAGEQNGTWLECVTDNCQTPVPDQVHFRIEFPRWLAAQTNRNRQIAETLALGHSTGEVARKLKLSPGRVSQIRRELYDSWTEITG